MLIIFIILLVQSTGEVVFVNLNTMSNSDYGTNPIKTTEINMK